MPDAKPVYFCNRCHSELETDAKGNHWCKFCKCFRPPFKQVLDNKS